MIGVYNPNGSNIPLTTLRMSLFVMLDSLLFSLHLLIAIVSLSGFQIIPKTLTCVSLHLSSRGIVLMNVLLLELHCHKFIDAELNNAFDCL